MPDHPHPATLLVGTENAHKLSEIRQVLADLQLPDGRPIQVVGTADIPQGEPIEETGATFEENAAIKARAYAQRARRLPPARRPTWVAADDSGLCVAALRGAPGVHSARYSLDDAPPEDEAARKADGAGRPVRGSVDRRNVEKLLAALREVPPGRRDAEFVCVIACVDVQAGDDLPVLFHARGTCRGEITLEPKGNGGFGYDPVFFFPPAGKTFAELSRAEKSRWSHRGQALRRLRQCLGELS